VDSHDQHLLVYFEALGLQPGRSVTVLQRNPLDGTLRVVIEGSQDEQVFGMQIAQAVFVSMGEE
jgi:Fe2+ transport system protein FeoA